MEKPLSILLVEDDETSRDILADLLPMRFPQIAFSLADNGRTGLECFRKHSPAIVITDINMPVMDGLRMAEAIKSIDSSVQIIGITAFSSNYITDLSKTANNRVDHFLAKPVDYRKLLALIEQCLAAAAPTPSP